MITVRPRARVRLAAALIAFGPTQVSAGEPDSESHSPPSHAPTALGGAHDHAMPTASDPGAEGASLGAASRDPHAYSDGYERGSGEYALPPGQALELADEHHFASFLADRFEQTWVDGSTFTAYDVLAWYGRDFDRLWVHADGEVNEGDVEQARSELLWGHGVAPFWDTLAGLRFDSGDGPSREWLVLGIQGLAPYWFEVTAEAYVGEGGRSALRVEVEYDLLLTQRFILQPRIESTLYGKEDSALARGSGLSGTEVGLRLRYEFTREIAPYVGVDWVRKHGDTGDFAREAGEPVSETRLVAGLRLWF